MIRACHARATDVLSNQKRHDVVVTRDRVKLTDDCPIRIIMSFPRAPSLMLQSTARDTRVIRACHARATDVLSNQKRHDVVVTRDRVKLTDVLSNQNHYELPARAKFNIIQ